MASEHASTNGAYPGQYNGGQYAGNGTAASQSEAEKSSQEQIGWYFVEKYYETLSQETQKLHVSRRFRHFVHKLAHGNNANTLIALL